MYLLNLTLMIFTSLCASNLHAAPSDSIDPNFVRAKPRYWSNFADNLHADAVRCARPMVDQLLGRAIRSPGEPTEERVRQVASALYLPLLASEVRVAKSDVDVENMSEQDRLKLAWEYLSVQGNHNCWRCNTLLSGFMQKYLGGDNVTVIWNEVVPAPSLARPAVYDHAFFAVLHKKPDGRFGFLIVDYSWIQFFKIEPAERKHWALPFVGTPQELEEQFVKHADKLAIDIGRDEATIRKFVRAFFYTPADALPFDSVTRQELTEYFKDAAPSGS